MADYNLEDEITKHHVASTRAAINNRTGDSIADYCKPVIMAEAITRKLESNQTRVAFLIVMDEVMKDNDNNKLQLITVATVYNEAMKIKIKHGQYTPMITETSDDILDHVVKYYKKVLCEMDDNSSSVNDDGRGDRFNDLEELIQSLVARTYKKGLFGKSKARWSLLKYWNNPRYDIGIIKDVRDELGEDEARRLFMELSDKVIDNPDLLNKDTSLKE